MDDENEHSMVKNWVAPDSHRNISKANYQNQPENLQETENEKI